MKITNGPQDPYAKKQLTGFWETKVRAVPGYGCVPPGTLKKYLFVNYKSCIITFRMITMDWIALIAFIVGIILVILGIAFLFNLSAIMLFFEKIIGFLCILLGVVALFFGWKLVKSV